jgi:predicted ATPase
MLKAKNLQEFIVRQGGGDDQFFMGARKTPRIHAKLCLETAAGLNDYRFDLVHVSAGDSVMVMNEAYRYSAKKIPNKAKWTEVGTAGKESGLLDQKHKTASTIVKLLQQCATYQFHDTFSNSLIHNRWDVTDSFRLRSDGGNLSAVLLDLRNTDGKRYELIVKQIRRILPAFKNFVLEQEAGKVLLRWEGNESDKVFGSHLTSDGSLRLFCLFTLLNLPSQRLPDVMFFDEPELGLHPHAITLVA